jgi:hypothetical protein
VIATGRAEEAKSHINAGLDLSGDSNIADTMVLTEAPETGDKAGAIKSLQNSKLQMSQVQRTAPLAAFEATGSNDTGQKVRAIQALISLPKKQQNFLVAKLLALLGANHDALIVFQNGFGSRYDWPSLLWYPSMRDVLRNPEFLNFAQRLGLLDYWRISRQRPDVCKTRTEPPFCRMI